MAQFRTLSINLNDLTVTNGHIEGSNVITIFSHKGNDYTEISGNYNGKVVKIDEVATVKAYFISSKPSNLLSSLNFFVESFDEDDLERLRSILPKLSSGDTVYQQIADFFGVGLSLYTLIATGYVLDKRVFINIDFYLKHLYAKDVLELVSLVLCCYISCHAECAEYLIVAKGLEFINVFIDGFDIKVINDYNQTQLILSTVKCLIVEAAYQYKCKMSCICEEYKCLSDEVCRLRQEMKSLQCELHKANQEVDCLRAKAKCKPEECKVELSCDTSRYRDGNCARPKPKNKVKALKVTELANLCDPDIISLPNNDLQASSEVKTLQLTEEESACDDYVPVVEVKKKDKQKKACSPMMNRLHVLDKQARAKLRQTISEPSGYVAAKVQDSNLESSQSVFINDSTTGIAQTTSSMVESEFFKC
jgi:hypothetical protein